MSQKDQCSIAKVESHSPEAETKSSEELVLTCGEWLLNSSDAAELEWDGVKGGIPIK